MATRIVACAAQEPQLSLVVALARPGQASLAKDSGELALAAPNGVAIEAFSPAAFTRADVWIEFAHAGITLGSVAAAVAARKPIVICTTGLDETTLKALKTAASQIPVLVAPNTSLGVAALNAALRVALRALGPNYAAEVVELHHDKKKDAPSGTALRLVDTIKEERGGRVVTGRDGLVGVRQSEEIGVFAVRGGNVIGEHTVYLFGEHDRIELTHRAQSRDLFAVGALRAAAFLVRKPAGWYTIEDCLKGNP